MYNEASQHHLGEQATAAGNRCKNNAALLQGKLALATEDEGEKADMCVAALLLPPRRRLPRHRFPAAASALPTVLLLHAG